MVEELANYEGEIVFSDEVVTGFNYALFEESIRKSIKILGEIDYRLLIKTCGSVRGCIEDENGEYFPIRELSLFEIKNNFLRRYRKLREGIRESESCLPEESELKFRKDYNI